MTDEVVPAPSYESRMSAFKKSWEAALPIIQKLLPTHVTAERIFSVAVTARQRNPALLECSDISILRGIIIGAQLGLDVSGVNGKAYLIPYRINGKMEAQFQVGYRGLMELARRTGQISAIYGDIVYEKDDFIYVNGLMPNLQHNRRMVGDPGPIIAAWAVAVWSNGFRQHEVMSRIEIDRVRDASRAGDSGPWSKWYDQMALKTVLRRLMKKLPDSVEIQAVVDIEDSAEAGLPPAYDVPLLEQGEPVEPKPTRTQSIVAEIKKTVPAPPPAPEKRGPGRPPKPKPVEPVVVPEVPPAELEEEETPEKDIEETEGDADDDY